MGLVIGYCKDCKFWEEYKPDEDDYIYESRLGWGECELTRMGQDGAIYPESTACAEDGEGYKAVLLTKPLHGCIQFQSKE